MPTKDCLVALNAHLDVSDPPYLGNRKFKRLSKRKNDKGQVVRVFADNLNSFEITGDGPYCVGRANTTEPCPSTRKDHGLDDLFAASVPYDPPPARPRPSASSRPGGDMGRGWYFGIGGPESSLVDNDFMEGVKCGFLLARKSYFDVEQCLESIHVSDELDGFPGEFEEVMEATFLSYLDESATRSWLVSNGFEPSEAIQSMASATD